MKIRTLIVAALLLVTAAGTSFSQETDVIYLSGKGYDNAVEWEFTCTKGRRSFWPESGRALSKNLNINDINLMKDMNMNAVRMSHYPPDRNFIEACDSSLHMVQGTGYAALQTLELWYG